MEDHIIRAEVHSDDHVIEVDFDAARYFKEADDDTLRSLIACAFRGDYPSDYVAQSEAERNEEVAKVFDYLALVAYKSDAPGFECVINEDDAMTWIQEHRPHLLTE